MCYVLVSLRVYDSFLLDWIVFCQIFLFSHLVLFCFENTIANLFFFWKLFSALLKSEN